MTGDETVTVTCPSQPGLLIATTPPVQFVDGEARVPADRLDELAAYRTHGVILPGDTEAEEDVEPEPEPEAENPAPKRTRAKPVRPFG